MKTIRVAGVPEHFNLPWHLAMDEGLFEKEKLQLFWTDFPDGTGAMCKALREDKVDVAVILTEGLVKDIIAGNPTKIVQEYIATPLIWGIHVAANSNFKSLEDLKGAKAAISRFGSGSHLMAIVNAQNMGWDHERMEFEAVGDINAAVDALENGKADYFMWEHFTTKPLVDKGIFRRLGDCPTPWPCFVIAVRDEFLQNNTPAVEKMLDILNSVSKNIKEIPAIEEVLATRYEQKLEDIKEWLQVTEWSQKQISVKELNKVQEQLEELQLIPYKIENSRFV